MSARLLSRQPIRAPQAEKRFDSESIPTVTSAASGSSSTLCRCRYLAAVSWQEPGTGNLFWSPTLVYGSAVGRQAGSNAAGVKTDKGGHRVISA